MAGYGSLSFLDYNGERSNMQFYTGNVTATSLPGILSEWGTLRSAIQGVILGTVAQEELSVFRTRLSNTLPSDANAQRERKWLVVYEDVTEFFDAPVNAIPNEGYRKVFTFEIPTAKLTGLLKPNSDEADLSNAAVNAFVNAFEQIARSPYGGRVNILKMVAVGVTCNAVPNTECSAGKKDLPAHIYTGRPGVAGSGQRRALRAD